jgi:hypothetical protein
MILVISDCNTNIYKNFEQFTLAPFSSNIKISKAFVHYDNQNNIFIKIYITEIIIIKKANIC